MFISIPGSWERRFVGMEYTAVCGICCIYVCIYIQINAFYGFIDLSISMYIYLLMYRADLSQSVLLRIEIVKSV